MPDESRKNPGHHDVFISYAQEDKPIADAVCARLESRNIRCWIAPRDIRPGQNFPEAIIEGIEEGKVVVLIFSSSANRSPHVMRELTNAVNKGRIIIPFRIEDVLPSKSMEYLISVPHWLDAVSPPLENHIDLLAGTVERFLHPENLPCTPAQEAPTRESTAEPLREKETPADREPPSPPVAVPDPVPAQPEPAPGGRPSGGSGRRGILIAGSLLVAAIILVAIWQAGFFAMAPDPSTTSAASNATRQIDYRSSDAPVNTVVLTTQPTEAMPKDNELFVGVSKDDSNAIVTVDFNGGPGLGHVRDNRVILTRSDGTVTEGTLNFNQRLSEVRLQGTRGTDRLQVIVTLYSGTTRTIVDVLLPYRTYH